jgi:type II secretory pathway pseudopilin PulG
VIMLYDRREGGFALVTVMLVVLVVAVLVTGAAIVGSTHTLSNRYYDRQDQLDVVALAGLELGRAIVNGDPSLYPDSGYVTLENGVTVTGPNGNPIPGVRRWLYVGPTGSISGQYGVFGSVVAVARDGGGGIAIRRSQLFQESFAKYAYFTDFEPANISFGGGDQLWGPVHTNSDLKIYSSGATFHDVVTTAQQVVGAQYGDFRRGYTERVPRIDMPRTADLNALLAQATAGGTAFTAGIPSGSGEAYLRIEFMALDLDGDGSTTGENEGFFRVYRSNDQRWLSGDLPSAGARYAQNCGHYHTGGLFVSAAAHPTSGPDSYVAALSSSTKRCYLGGADSIFGAFTPDDGTGQWMQNPAPPSPLLSARADREYLFPISRSLNPNFKGVIHVTGRVVISGVVRGRVTLAATDEIVVGDDITYVSDPGLGTCVDILGLFSGTRIVVADNTLNAPFRPATGSNYFTYDDTKDEFIHAVVLALDQFTVEDYSTGSTRDERCESALWGRGCLYLTGGIIQNTRGAVGTIQSPGGTGYVKRYAYDKCGATSPPPYFPTTGRFVRGQRYWVEPAGFDVDDYYASLTSN